MLKKCARCRIEKDVSEFGKKSSEKDGLQRWCKECRKEYYREYKEKNYDRLTSYQKLYRESNKDLIQIRNKNYYAKNKDFISERRRYIASTPDGYKRQWCYRTREKHKRIGYDVQLSSDDLFKIIKNINNCEICGCLLEWWPTGKASNESPTLDRLNNEQCINENNIQVLCLKCNTMKHNNTIPELINWCELVLSKYKYNKNIMEIKS